MRGWAIAAVGGLAAACGADPGLGDDDGGGPPPAGTVTILAPFDGAAFARDQLDDGGAFVAPIAFSAQAGGDVVSVDWLAEGVFALGTGASPDFAVVYDYRGDGDRWVVAVGRDAGGAEVARATVAFTVAPPPPSDCEGMLGALGIEFTSGPDNLGVPTPVTVTMPVRGIWYRYGNSENRRQTWFMDCELALSMWRAGEVFAADGVTEVRDYGIYNYRCIDQSVEPPCPGSELSMHAYAQAIDIAGLVDGAGTTYSVNNDWVIDPDAEETCSAPTADPKDAFLHQVVCDLYTARVFNYYLTPNYNAAHRDHWHLDLTPGGDFIERLAPPESGFHR